MTKVVELTFAESVDLNRINSAGVLQGMYDLLDELIECLDDPKASEMFCELKERIKIIDKSARKNIKFTVAQ